MEIPQTRYANAGDVSIAYQVIGEGPIDLVIAHGFFSHLELDWEWPSCAQMLRRLASFARVIVFDKRGTGLSDPIEGAPTLEERMDDIRAVMDAAGSTRAALFGYSEGGPMSMLFAASYPERVSQLILYGSFARLSETEDYPDGIDADEFELIMASIQSTWAQSGASPTAHPDSFAERIFPSEADNPSFHAWISRRTRHGTSPKMALAIMRLNFEIDVRAVLPEIRVPTLIAYRKGDLFIRPALSRYLAPRMPNAKLVELPGADHMPWTGDIDGIIDEIEEFLTGARGGDVDRALATVMFTDIVDSTALASELGDKEWRRLLDQHDAFVKKTIERYRGHVIKTTGDGALATFDGPARAIRCARHLTSTAPQLGIEIRAGLHTGECELRGEDVGGVAVHIGARVAGLAGAGDVFVSGTVKDLVIGSGIGFAERGTHQLKGVPGAWPIFAAVQDATD